MKIQKKKLDLVAYDIYLAKLSVRGQKQAPQKQTTPPHSYSNILPEWSLLGPRSSWLGLCATRPSGTLKTSKPKEGMEELYTHALKQSLVFTL